MINGFCTDSSLLMLEAMFSHSPAWHTVKDLLHCTFKSSLSCISRNKIWQTPQSSCPARWEYIHHISTNSYGLILCTTVIYFKRKLLQCSLLDESEINLLCMVYLMQAMCFLNYTAFLYYKTAIMHIWYLESSLCGILHAQSNLSFTDDSSSIWP